MSTFARRSATKLFELTRKRQGGLPRFAAAKKRGSSISARITFSTGKNASRMLRVIWQDQSAFTANRNGQEKKMFSRFKVDISSCGSRGSSVGTGRVLLTGSS